MKKNSGKKITPLVDLAADDGGLQSIMIYIISRGIIHGG